MTSHTHTYCTVQDGLAGSRFFEKPVDQSALADYTKVIPNLIDFATIRSKLGTGNTYVVLTSYN